MPWTIYLYILRDVIKLLVISTVILLSIISFAAAIKPLADGLLGPADIIRFMFYAAPGMLGFVLPFCAAFASTVVFIRLVQDNELTAIAASGISYRLLLAPILALGLLLGTGLWSLSNIVVPHFFRQAADLVERDAIGIMLAELNRNQPFRHSGWVIYADKAVEIPLTADVLARYQDIGRPVRVLSLEGVAVSELDQQRRSRSDATARLATVVLFEHPELEHRWVSIRLRDPVYFDPIRGQFTNELLDQPELVVPDRFTDQLQFLAWDDLRELDEHPTRFGRVRHAVQRLGAALAMERMQQLIVAQAGDPQSDTMLALASPLPGEQYQFEASGPVTTRTREIRLASAPQKPVLVTRLRDGQALRWFEADQLRLVLRIDQELLEPVIDATLMNVMVLDARDAPPTEHSELRLPPLRWQGASMLEDVRLPGAQGLNLDLLREASLQAGMASEPVARALEQVDQQLKLLHHQIIMLHHNRLALAVTCVQVILLGALLAMVMRHQMVLTIYLISFILTLATVLIINTLWNMSRSDEYSLMFKMGMLWSGNLVLLLVMLGLYRRVLRH